MPGRDRRAAEEKALSVDVDARVGQVWSRAAAQQRRVGQHDRSALRSRRGARPDGADDLSVQGFPSLHGREPRQSGRGPTTEGRGRAATRYLQDDRRRVLGAADGPRAVEGRDGRRAGLARPGRLQPAVGSDRRRREGQAGRPDQSRRRVARPTAASSPRADAQRGRERLCQNPGDGGPARRRRRERRVQRKTADHPQERPAGVLRRAGRHFAGRRPRPT